MKFSKGLAKFSSVLVLSLVVVVAVVAVAAYANSGRYTRAELDSMSHDQLVSLAMSLQDQVFGPDPGNGGGGSWGPQCKTFNPLNGESGDVLLRYNHPGYGDDGTLRWPNGQTFYLRHSGYGDDGTLFYSTGQVIRLVHSGYGDNGSFFWPNGKTLLLRHSGYGDDGSIFRSDGSAWLIRHAGYGDDHQRVGLPTAQWSGDGFMDARLNGESVLARYEVRGQGWTVELVIDTASSSPVFVRECF